MQVKDIMTRDVVSVDKDERLQRVLALMRKHRISKLPVLEQEAVVGVVSDGHIVNALGALKNAGVPASSLHVSNAMTREFPTLSPLDDVSAVVLLFRTEDGLGLAPVVEDDVLMGVVTKADLLPLVQDETPLEKFMVTELHAVGPQDRVIHARRLMVDNAVERLPVLEEGHVVGVVAETDIAYGYEAFKKQIPANHQEAQLRNFLVEDVCERHVITAEPSTSARAAAERMHLEHVGCLPVVDASGTIQGLVTRTDLIRRI